MKASLILATGIAVSLLSQSAVTAAAPMRPAAAIGQHAMVATAQHYATDVGLHVLQNGGNAIDAAVATGYALAVVDPCCGNLGGGGFMTIHLASAVDGAPQNIFLSFQVRAPLKVGRIASHGYLSAAIPGSVAGLEYAREHWGTMPRAELIAPAIALAKYGFTLKSGDVALIGVERRRLARDPEAARIFLRHGQPPAIGSRLVQSDLARTLQTISNDGAAAVYGGSIGKALIAASRTHGGPFSKVDFTSYRVESGTPLQCSYRGLQVFTTRPPSAGGLAICETLGILNGFDMKALGFRTVAGLHDELEAERRAYADAFTLVGDPDFAAIPADELASPAHADILRAQITERATPSSQIDPHATMPNTGTHTTSYSVVDAPGNAIAVTYTLSDYFGAMVVAPKTGILLNNTLSNFNHHGHTGPNRIAPGKRPISSMSPTIVLRDGKPYLVIGSAGGSRIVTENLAMIRNVIDYGMNVQDAISEPRVHEQWKPDVVTVEPGALTPRVTAALVALGYKIKVRTHAPQDSDGIEIAPDGTLFGGYDAREGAGSAEGY